MVEQQMQKANQIEQAIKKEVSNIKINVGGKNIEVPYKVLTNVPGSKLQEFFEKVETDKVVTLDRNYEAF